MKRYFPAIYWAVAMIVLAIGARSGWVDRDAATTMLLIMPLVAFTAIITRRSAGCTPWAS